MKHTLTALVQDTPGVLARIAGMFSRRGFNIDSLTVSPSEESGLSRMTFSVVCDRTMAVQMQRQLNKLIDVVEVCDISEVPAVERELILVKVQSSAAVRTELNTLVDPFRASIVDVGRNSLIVQATGNKEKNDALLELLYPYGILEIARTGVTAMVRSQVELNKVAVL